MRTMKTVLSNLILFLLIVYIPVACKSVPEGGSRTIENLKSAYRNEVNANSQYAAYSQKAKEENMLQVAILYSAISKSESIHARNHKEILLKMGITPEDFSPKFELKSTIENLQISIQGETNESTNIYIDYIAMAEKEGMKDAKKSFTWAMNAEMKHTGYYTAALAAVTDNRVSSLADSYLVCPVCGQTFEARQHDGKCSSCKSPREKFISFP
jgi:rubrerythrin